VANKLDMFCKDKNVDLMEYDILTEVNPLERRRKIQAFNTFWTSFTAYLQEAGLVAQTRNSYRQIVKAILNYAKAQYGIMVMMPSIEKTVKYKDRKRILDEAVVTHLFSLPSSHHWAVNVVKLALYSCWRIGDLVSIETDDLTEGEFLGERVYFITKVTKKTKKIMKTPVPVTLIRDMMRRYNVAPGDKLIKFPNKRKITERDVIEQVRSLFNSNQFLREQKVQTVNTQGDVINVPFWTVNRPMHLLRSAGASYLISNGLTPEAVAKWFTGHESALVLANHYVTSENFMGAKELFRDRFAVTHIKNADKAMAILCDKEE
jgi:integrase